MKAFADFILTAMHDHDKDQWSLREDEAPDTTLVSKSLQDRFRQYEFKWKTHGANARRNTLWCRCGTPPVEMVPDPADLPPVSHLYLPLKVMNATQRQVEKCTLGQQHLWEDRQVYLPVAGTEPSGKVRPTMDFLRHATADLLDSNKRFAQGLLLVPEDVEAVHLYIQKQLLAEPGLYTPMINLSEPGRGLYNMQEAWLVECPELARILAQVELMATHLLSSTRAPGVPLEQKAYCNFITGMDYDGHPTVSKLIISFGSVEMDCRTHNNSMSTVDTLLVAANPHAAEWIRLTSDVQQQLMAVEASARAHGLHGTTGQFRAQVINFSESGEDRRAFEVAVEERYGDTASPAWRLHTGPAPRISVAAAATAQAIDAAAVAATQAPMIVPANESGDVGEKKSERPGKGKWRKGSGKGTKRKYKHEEPDEEDICIVPGQRWHIDQNTEGDLGAHTSLTPDRRNLLFIVPLGSTFTVGPQLALCDFGDGGPRRPWLVELDARFPVQVPLASSPFLSGGPMQRGDVFVTFTNVMHRGVKLTDVSRDNGMDMSDKSQRRSARLAE
jgi:hypothetical protein